MSRRTAGTVSDNASGAGNVLDFVALKEGVTVRQAAVHISDWFGLTFDAPVSGTESKSAGSKPASKPAAPKAESKSAAAPDSGPDKPLTSKSEKVTPVTGSLKVTVI